MGKFIDLTNKRFERLIVVSRDLTRLPVAWVCKCDCGKVTSVLSEHLRRGRTKSCGCLHNEQLSARVATHRQSTSREYRIYSHIKARCTNQKHPRWERYGGRGIRMCERWLASFEAFLSDMGPCPSNRHSIDRIDNDGHYVRDNCRWATPGDQSRNTSRTRLMTLDGRTQCMADWAAELGVSPTAIRKRIACGWPVEDAISLAPKRTNKGGRGVVSPLDRVTT